MVAWSSAMEHKKVCSGSLALPLLAFSFNRLTLAGAHCWAPAAGQVMKQCERVAHVTLITLQGAVQTSCADYML